MNLRSSELTDPIETGLEGEISRCETLQEIDRLKPIVYQIHNEILVELWRKKYWSLAPKLKDRQCQ